MAAGGLLEDDPALALEHARAARDRASRIAAVREAVGVAAYYAGDFAEAGRELRAYRRMSGDESYRAVLADCERALGRPDNALRLVQEALATNADADETVELTLVEAGARQDLGEPAAAALVLETALGGRPTPATLGEADLGRLRLAIAYADLLEDRGEVELASEWYGAIAAADADDLTGVSDRFGDQDDVEDLDVEDLDDDRVVEDGGNPAGESSAGVVPTDEPAGTAPDSRDGAIAGLDIDEDEDLGEQFGDEVDVNDIEAEVAELLGEVPPRPAAEFDHSRLFQEAPAQATAESDVVEDLDGPEFEPAPEQAPESGEQHPPTN